MGRFLLLFTFMLIPFSVLVLVLKKTIQGLAGNVQSSSNPLPSLQGLLMMLLPLPVLLAAFISLVRGNVAELLGNAAGSALLLSGAWLLRRGLLAASHYPRRHIARVPYPLKTLGSSLIALGTGITAGFGVHHHPVVAMMFGLLALLGCYLTYGFDPLTTKRFTDAEGLDVTDRVLEALTQAEQGIIAIEQATREIGNVELNDRLRRIARLAREILQRLEEDPRDLRRARKFLNVYLDGVRQVVEGFARTHDRIAKPELEENFRQVLITIEEVFTEQQQKLLAIDVDDLDVRIEVLMTQLKREGVA